jgi:hypothetical protein
MTFEGLVPSFAGRRAESLNRSNCSWATPLFKRLNDTWAKQDLVHAPNDAIKLRLTVLKENRLVHVTAEDR